jgi:membrane protease YdiL (CAAX protease family)
VPSAIDQLAFGAIPLPIVAIFAVVIGPLFEELAFRGFLQPLLQQWSGSYAGILLTAAAFSCLHGWNYEWHWQYLLVLLLVGSAFGIARDRTGSTAASFMLHMGYNLTQLAGAVAAQQLS